MEFILIIVFIIILIIKLLNSEFHFESRRKKAGRRGENMIANKIQNIKNDKDMWLRNIVLIYEQTTELDNVIINENGVFIIEVKNWTGKIIGNENDFKWKKYSGYWKAIKNPIKQVKRQIYILSSFLKSYGINVWIEGYVIFVNDNSPCKSEYILNYIDELELILHDKMRKQLNKKQMNQIFELLKNLDNKNK